MHWGWGAKAARFQLHEPGPRGQNDLLARFRLSKVAQRKLLIDPSGF